jgi:hypothetical protein
MSTALNDLAVRLGLTDDEALAIFALQPLEAIAGDVGHRPEVAILDDLSREAQERLGPGALPRWLRAGPPGGRPLDLLIGGDFAAFEDALGRRLSGAA